MTPEAFRRAVAAAVHQLRLERDLTQDQLGISRAQLHNIEQGKGDVKAWTLATIAKAMQISFPALAAEIDRRRVLPATETSEEQMLPGGIFLVVRGGRLDLAKCAGFFDDALGAAKKSGARKLLLDLYGLHCDFSAQEQYQGAKDGMKWYERNGYQPEALAVVANHTLDGFGAQVARDDGLNVLLFSKREEALAWLSSLA